MSKLIIGTAGIGRSEKANGPEKMLKKLDHPYKVFDWQQYIEKESDTLTEFHTSYGSGAARKLRSVMYDYLYDETAYAKNRMKILDALDLIVRASDAEEIVLIGHSWGSVIMYDYCNNVKNLNKKIKLITMGCPLPFKLGFDIKSKVSSWDNYWEKNDPIAHKMHIIGCYDLEFKSYHWIKGWNVLAHASYLKSRRLAKRIKKSLA